MRGCIGKNLISPSVFLYFQCSFLQFVGLPFLQIHAKSGGDMMSTLLPAMILPGGLDWDDDFLLLQKKWYH